MAPLTSNDVCAETVALSMSYWGKPTPPCHRLLLGTYPTFRQRRARVLAKRSGSREGFHLLFACGTPLSEPFFLAKHPHFCSCVPEWFRSCRRTGIPEVANKRIRTLHNGRNLGEPVPHFTMHAKYHPGSQAGSASMA